MDVSNEAIDCMPKSLLSSPKTPRAVLNVTQGRVMVTLENVGALRQTALADEHLMICICGVDVTRDCSNAQVLRDALQKMVRIKMQMGTNHQICLARTQASSLIIEQEFTSDIDLLVAGVSSLIVAAAQEDVLDLDALMADVARYFDAQRQLETQATLSLRLLLILRQMKGCPRLYIKSQVEVTPANHLDVIYWHQDMPTQAAQNVLDQLCAYDTRNPLANCYFLEVSESFERLHQTLVLMLSHPAHRLSQTAAEQLLLSCFSPSIGIGSYQN